MMSAPDTRYATTHDGVSIAYQTVGEGPVDLVLGLSDWGNVETMWELDALADLFERLSRFSRLVLHDRRGTGLSGGGGFPNLETRAQDLLAVLDSIRSPKAVLFGEQTQGSAFAVLCGKPSESCLLAHLVQGRRHGVLVAGVPVGRNGRPTCVTAVAWVEGNMGTTKLAREWLTRAAPSLAGDEQRRQRWRALDRHFMAPSTAAEWMYVENQTDVTAILPLLRCPTLVLDYEESVHGPAESRHVQSMIPGSELQLIPPGDPSSAREREFLLPYVDRAYRCRCRPRVHLSRTVF